MSLSEIRGESAIDLLADLMEPASVILSDEEVQKAFRTNGNEHVKTAIVILRRHGKETLEVLAAVNQTPLEEYDPNPWDILRSAVEVLADPGLTNFFTLQGQKKAEKSSGPVSGSTEDQKE